jgi:hypothetical protein
LPIPQAFGQSVSRHIKPNRFDRPDLRLNKLLIIHDRKPPSKKPIAATIAAIETKRCITP